MLFQVCFCWFPIPEGVSNGPLKRYYPFTTLPPLKSPPMISFRFSGAEFPPSGQRGSHPHGSGAVEALREELRQSFTSAAERQQLLVSELRPGARSAGSAGYWASTRTSAARKHVPFPKQLQKRIEEREEREAREGKGREGREGREGKGREGKGKERKEGPVFGV